MIFYNTNTQLLSTKKDGKDTQCMLLGLYKKNENTKFYIYTKGNCTTITEMIDYISWDSFVGVIMLQRKREEEIKIITAYKTDTGRNTV